MQKEKKEQQEKEQKEKKEKREKVRAEKEKEKQHKEKKKQEKKLRNAERKDLGKRRRLDTSSSSWSSSSSSTSSHSSSSRAPAQSHLPKPLLTRPQRASKAAAIFKPAQKRNATASATASSFTQAAFFRPWTSPAPTATVIPPRPIVHLDENHDLHDDPFFRDILDELVGPDLPVSLPSAAECLHFETHHYVQLEYCAVPPPAGTSLNSSVSSTTSTSSSLSSLPLASAAIAFMKPRQVAAGVVHSPSRHSPDFIDLDAASTPPRLTRPPGSFSASPLGDLNAPLPNCRKPAAAAPPSPVHGDRDERWLSPSSRPLVDLGLSVSAQLPVCVAPGKFLSSFQIEDHLDTLGIVGGFTLAHEFATQLVHEGTFRNGKLRLGSYRCVFGPVMHSQMKHWLTLFIDIEQRSFTLIDSLGTTKDQLNTAFANWLLYVENDPALRAIHAARPFQLVEVSHPLQTDGYNCGVFTCCLIDMLAKHQAINTNSFGDNTQTYMDDYRKNIRA